MNQATRTMIVAAVTVAFTTVLQAQTPASTPSQSTSQTPASSSSAPQSAPTPAATSTPAPVGTSGTYISSDPLSGVRYNQRWDASVGLAYGHIHAGPTIREGANLGGLDLSASYRLNSRWRIEASGRSYMGTSGTTPIANRIGESGVFVAQYMFLAGPEYLGPHNKHGAISVHALVGGAYGDFNKDLGRQGSTTGPTGPAGFYDNQVGLGGAFGGHIDLNRSEHWAFRVTPDALLTTYDGTSQYPHTQWNFGISVGAQYKFTKKRK